MKLALNHKYIFLSIVVFYALILSQFGMENYDTGYISSFSWRILNGEIPYRNFIYKFPPVTIYFHALLMKLLPETGQFYFFRIFSYLLFSLQIYFIVSGINALYDLKKYNINKWGLMTVCFTVSLLNFIPSPWPTTDGLFFASLAFWLVARNQTINALQLFITALFTVLCALSKQSFYLVPMIFTIWIYFRYGFRKTLIHLVFLAMLVMSFIFLITQLTTLENYLKLTTGETHLYQIYYYGFYSFVFLPIKWLAILVVSIAIGFGGYFYFNKKNIVDLKPLLLYLSFSVFAVSLLFTVAMNAKTASVIAFDGAVLALVYAYLFQKKTLAQIMPMLVLLSISWSVSISRGYPYPILFATAMIITFVLVLKNEIHIKPAFTNTTVTLLCISCFAVNIRPYREKTVNNLTYSLGSVSNKLAFIKTNKENYEKHLELKALIDKYGENFIVAPDFPMANYLFDHQSELPADWIINTEVNRQYNRFIRLAAEEKNYIFLEKSFIEGEEFRASKMEDFSYIAWYIHKHFNPIEQTDHFIVYHSLKKHETLP